jgi:16S rRNA (cytosine1407-C5)-methyltransferase
MAAVSTRREGRAFPEEFLQRLRRIVPSNRWAQIAATFSHPRPTTFRVNSLIATPQAVRERLMSAGFQVEQVPWYPDAMILRRGGLRQLQQTPLYRTGAIYVQSLSSMLPPLALAPRPGETILDLTAAPGSKTTQMACLMRGEGRIVANDRHRIRCYKLRANVSQQAARNVEVTCCDGGTFGRRHPGAFDRVLVDAPCSGEGRFLTFEPASYRSWSLMKIRRMALTQRRLLASAVGALRPGGVLVYSTCTLAPEENEGVTQWALEQFRTTLSLEPTGLSICDSTPALARWDAQVFHASLRHARRILPTHDTEAFFIARLRKQPEV